MQLREKFFIFNKKVFTSVEFILTILLMLIGLLSVYVCFDEETFKRQLVFFSISFVYYVFFSFLATNSLIKKWCIPGQLLLLVSAIVITVLKEETGYINFGPFSFNIAVIIMLSVVISSVMLYMISKNKEIKDKPMWYLFVLLPVIVISAFNSSAIVLIYIVTIVVSNILPRLTENCKVEKVMAYVLLVLLAISVFTIFSIIVVSLMSDNFAATFQSGELQKADVSGLEYIFFINRSGLLMPLFFVILILCLSLIMIIKAFSFKSNFNKTIVFSVSFSLFFYLVSSVLLEVFFKDNRGIGIPFLSGMSMDLMSAFMISISVSALYSAGSNKIDYAYCVKCIISVFKWRRNRASVSTKPIAFISYRRETGSDLAMHIHDRLWIKGINTFFDIESMKAGKFNEQIFVKIEECDNFILVLSKGALDRCVDEGDWVRREIAYAIERKKTIITLMTKDFVFPEKLPEEIETIRYFQGISCTNEFFDFVIEKLISMMEK